MWRQEPATDTMFKYKNINYLDMIYDSRGHDKRYPEIKFSIFMTNNFKKHILFCLHQQSQGKELFKQDIVDVMDQILSNIPDAVQI